MKLWQVALLGLAAYAVITTKRKPAVKPAASMQVGPDKPIVSGGTVVG
jgi:hypothetical protein